MTIYLNCKIMDVATSSFMTSYVCLLFYVFFNQKCPNSIRHVMGMSPDLQNVYKPDVPILLSKGDVTEAEYKRLVRYNTMTGWKGIKYQGKVKGQISG